MPRRCASSTSKGDTDSLGLNSRIDTLPTAVVMRNGREVDRIVGYWGPTGFFQLLSHILADGVIGGQTPCRRSVLGASDCRQGV